MRRPELLAPAGNRDALIAAVTNGADAIYLGLKKFGARNFADNFSHEEFIEAVNYCHQYSCKVYVTLNTLIPTEDFEEVFQEALFLHEHNVDAVLVQDLGLATYLKKRIPDLQIHASTQMHIHNREGVREVKNIGFSRVVLARETPKELVKEIIKEGIEVEIFVQGALCVCYSGQCYLSLENGNRSGNKGTCGQPCRLNYQLLEDYIPIQTKGNYLLSPKDLYTLDHIDELMDMNVSCWKIEGRMKRSEYVGLITRQYRLAIDAYRNKSSFTPDELSIRKLFNREFTSGHLFNQRGMNLMNPYRPNHQGVPLGIVTSFNNNKVSIKLFHSLNQFDGIRFASNDEGFIVNKIYKNGLLVSGASPNEIIEVDYDSYIKTGTNVLLTTDSHLMKDIQESFKKPIRTTKVALNVKAFKGSPMKMTLIYQNIVIALLDEENLQEASKHVLTKEQWIEQLSRTQDTSYTFDPIDIQSDPDVFVPVSRINEMRRRLLNALTERLTKEKDVYVNEYTSNDIQTKNTSRIQVTISSIEQYENIKDLDIDIYTKDATLANKLNIGYCYPRVNEEVSEVSTTNAYINELGQVNLNIENKIASMYFNITNPYTIRYLLEKGCSSVELSRELSDEEITTLINKYHVLFNSKPNLTFLIYGRRELMVSKYCAVNTHLTDDYQKHCGKCKLHTYCLKDANHKIYPLEFDKDCFMHILEPKPFDRTNDIQELRNLGINNFHVVLTDETGSEARNLINKLKSKEEH